MSNTVLVEALPPVPHVFVPLGSRVATYSYATCLKVDQKSVIIKYDSTSECGGDYREDDSDSDASLIEIRPPLHAHIFMIEGDTTYELRKWFQTQPAFQNPDYPELKPRRGSERPPAGGRTQHYWIAYAEARRYPDWHKLHAELINGAKAELEKTMMNTTSSNNKRRIESTQRQRTKK